MVTATLKEEIQRISTSSIVMVTLPLYSLVGHLKHYEDGIALVPGEQGANYGRLHPYHRITGYKKLTPRVVQPSEIQNGDMVRISEEGFRIVGFVRRIGKDSLFLASGDKGFPTQHKFGMEVYEKLE